MMKSQKRERMLTQNRELRRINAWNWTLPALAVRLEDGRTIKTCPAAGVCVSFCYARHGTYRFSNVRAKHIRNLVRTFDLPQWESDMIEELGARRFRGGRYVRVHDSGDFYSDDYTESWMTVCTAVPDVTFYCYTKEIDRFKRLVEPNPPANFLWCYSFGGREDHMINPETDRVADVFPDEEAISAAGYHSNEESDLLAVLGPTPVGISANRIPHLQKRQGELTFRQWQATKRQPRRDVTRGQAHAQE